MSKNKISTTFLDSKDEETILNIIADIVKNQRKLKKVKQSELAKAVGVTQSYISKIEAGKVVVDIKVWIRICKILDIENKF